MSNLIGSDIVNIGSFPFVNFKGEVPIGIVDDFRYILGCCFVVQQPEINNNKINTFINLFFDCNVCSIIPSVPDAVYFTVRGEPA